MIETVFEYIPFQRDFNIDSLERMAVLIGQMRVSRSDVTFTGLGDPFTALPPPIVLKVLSFLDPGSVSIPLSSRYVLHYPLIET